MGHEKYKFLHRHQNLLQASFDLGDLTAQRAAVYVGAHSFNKRMLPPGLKIGLQTEHFYDQTGAKLWGLPSRAAILRWALQYDVLSSGATAAEKDPLCSLA